MVETSRKTSSKEMKTHFLITGGTGVIGKQLTQKLLAQGKKVTVLCRTPQQRLFPEYREQLSWLKGDVSLPMLGLSPETYKKIASQTAGIFHLAARTDFNGKSLDYYKPINIDGVKNVYQLANISKCHLHHVSTAFVCGCCSGIFQEDSLENGQVFRNFYEESKFLGEKYLREQMKTDYIPITIYRPGIILERNPNEASGKKFGPITFLDAVLRVLTAAQRRSQNLDVIRVVGSRHGSLPLIFDDSVADTLLALSCLTNIDSRTFHLVSKHPFANHILEDIFNEVFGRQVARYADAVEFKKKHPTPAEELLARRTKIYDNYMDISLSFGRQNLEEMLGHHVLPSPTFQELLNSFSLFLAQKKDSTQVLEKKKNLHQAEEVENYFYDYLPTFFGNSLIKNLINLNASLWLNIEGVNSWSIVISKGCLISISLGHEGLFGYTIAPQAFLDIVRGRHSPQEGFFRGQIKITGDTREALRTATALEEFFRKYPYHRLKTA
jgi:nucleoside-diphosphate-sugar epimerase